MRDGKAGASARDVRVRPLLRGGALLLFLMLAVGCADDDGGSAQRASCDPLPVPEAATGIIGLQSDGTFLGHDGRRAGGVGSTIVLDAVSQGFVTHPTLPLAYVSLYGRGGRRIAVVDYQSGVVLQTVREVDPQGKAVLSPDGRRLFVPLGTERLVQVFEVDAAGMLSAGPTVDVGDRVVALHVSADGSTLWAGLFSEGELVAIDLPSLAERARIELDQGAWDLLELEERGELYVSDLTGSSIAVVDTHRDAVLAKIEVVSSPARMTRNTDGSVVWVPASGGDSVYAIDTATRTVRDAAPVAEADLVDAGGGRLPNSNPNAAVYDATTNRLYVTRGTDNAITVYDADSLAAVGSIPTLWWPNDIALTETAPGVLLVSEGQGGGIDPEPNDQGERSDINNGALSAIDLGTLDLEATTKLVEQNQVRSIDRYGFDCPSGEFPIPTRDGQVSPIEHVILVVKENKKFDAEFGDFDLPGIDADPSLVKWTADINPNQRKLARDFNLSDRFFSEAQESDSGHLFLTSAHLTEFTQRFFTEDAGNLGIGWPVEDFATPDAGNIFTHLMDHGKSIRIYGEIVGMFQSDSQGRTPIIFSDPNYPGGPYINYLTKDKLRAQYVVDQARANGLPDFTYMLLPNDHGEGTTPGRPTPESHVADNDEGLGILVQGISSIPELWQKTAIFILEDDPQGAGDHVSAARSFLIVASPWARHGGYVSHTQISFLSVHATIFRILGVPPLGREDASAAPLWDFFTTEPDFTPYEMAPRVYPEEVNPPDAFGAAASLRMDFRSPDRNPDLGRLVGLYRAVRMRRMSRAEAERRLAEPPDDDEYQEAIAESAEEITAWERDFAKYQEWLAQRGKTCLPTGEIVPLRN